jgi:hypothetical protein
MLQVFCICRYRELIINYAYALKDAPVQNRIQLSDILPS